MTPSRPAPPGPPARSALFLDVDGALLDIASTPGAVIAPLDVIELIGRLTEALGGALALLSGRAIIDLDRIFAPLRIPCAGVHGAELRIGERERVAVPVDHRFLAEARDTLGAFSRSHPWTLLEDKGIALALHTRHAPDVSAEAGTLVAGLAARSHGRFAMQRGKHVHELKPALANKGAALSTFMREPPFHGRVPIVVGDDLTDAYAFRAARDLGGVSIAIGADAPPATMRLRTPADCRQWLSDWVDAARSAR